MERELTMEELRVLGSLLEKEMATPDYYPLTLNHLLSACNQKSNRDPVVCYDEDTVLQTIDALRDIGLAFRVDLVDSRVPKYEHNMGKKMDLTVQELAIMSVLMLRGALTLAKIKERTTRLYPFEDREEVEVTLDGLTEREEPLVMRFPPMPGQKEARYAHLLAGEPDLPETGAAMTREVRTATAGVDAERMDQLEEEVATLNEKLESLQQQFDAFKAQFE